MALICGAAVAATIYRLRHRWIHRAVTRSATIEPKRALIQALSYFGAGSDPKRTQLSAAYQASFQALAMSTKQADAVADQLPAPQAAALKALERFPWQQNLRSLAPHLGRIERLLVVTSKESDADFEPFNAWLQHLLRDVHPGLVIERAPGTPTNLEEQGDLSRLLRRAIDQLANLGIPSRDICIDVTSGTRSFTFAVAVETINRDLGFTYVTNEGEVFVYDARVSLGEF